MRAGYAMYSRYPAITASNRRIAFTRMNVPDQYLPRETRDAPRGSFSSELEAFSGSFPLAFKRSSGSLNLSA